jgi:hypothetical protein
VCSVVIEIHLLPEAATGGPTPPTDDPTFLS